MFEHKMLDGAKCRVINVENSFVKPEVLEIRDPKNGTALESACRTQYAVAGEVLVERYLPPETIGDQWPHDSSAAPWWLVVGHPPHGGVVADFNKHTGGAYHRTLDPNRNVVAYAEQGEEVIFNGSNFVVKRQSDAQELSEGKLVTLRQAYYN